MRLFFCNDNAIMRPHRTLTEHGRRHFGHSSRFRLPLAGSGLPARGASAVSIFLVVARVLNLAALGDAFADIGSIFLELE